MAAITSRAQLPVYSPLTGQAVAKGLASLLRSEGARHAVVERLQRRFGSTAVLLTDSGTTALQLAMRRAAARFSGPIAIPGYCCYDVATAVVGAGVPIRCYDLNPATLSPSIESLDRVLQDGAAAVVVVHLYGIPIDLRSVTDLCERQETPLIEDAAQAFGATHGDRSIGSFGSVAILSFGRGKGVTGGSGGCLLANDEQGEQVVAEARSEVHEAARGWGSVGKATAQWLIGRPSLYGLLTSAPILRLGETYYRRPWMPASLSAASAGLVSATLALEEEERRTRQATARRLLRTVRRASLYRPVHPPVEAEPSYLRLPILTARRGKPQPDGARTTRLGIMRGYPAPLNELRPLAPQLAGPPEHLPGSHELVSSLLTLPTHSRLKERDLRRLEAWLEGDRAL